MEEWTGCIAGALTAEQFTLALTGAGLVDIEIRPTHRVHSQASAAIIRARKPTGLRHRFDVPLPEGQPGSR